MICGGANSQGKNVHFCECQSPDANGSFSEEIFAEFLFLETGFQEALRFFGSTDRLFLFWVALFCLLQIGSNFGSFTVEMEMEI